MLFEAIRTKSSNSIASARVLRDWRSNVSEALITIAGNVRNTGHYLGSRGGNEKPQADLST